jgi:hypothetical protein
MDKFRKECVEAHNRYRKIHGVPPLRLDPQVILTAIPTHIFMLKYIFNYDK